MAKVFLNNRALIMPGPSSSSSDRHNKLLAKKLAPFKSAGCWGFDFASESSNLLLVGFDFGGEYTGEAAPNPSHPVPPFDL